MSSDPCLKPFIAYDRQDNVAFKNGLGLGNSCWVDSLFVAFFHTNKESIQQFIDDLEIKKYFGVYFNPKIILENKFLNMSDQHKQQLENCEEEIIKYIKYIYLTINSNVLDYEKKYVCYNFRIKLEKHRNILLKYNIFKTDKSFESFEDLNNPSQLLQYLKEYVLDEKCFNNIQLVTKPLLNDDNPININNYLTNFTDYRDINFFHIIYNVNGNNEGFFDNPNNDINEEYKNKFLYSIIVHLGAHYTCYYKCKNRWYYYNDVEDIRNRTKIIGNFDDVKEDHNKIFRKKEGDYEIMLLYLNENVQLERDSELDKQIAITLKDDIDKQIADESRYGYTEEYLARKFNLVKKLQIEKEDEQLAKELLRESNRANPQQQHVARKQEEQLAREIKEQEEILKKFEKLKLHDARKQEEQIAKEIKEQRELFEKQQHHTRKQEEQLTREIKEQQELLEQFEKQKQQELLEQFKKQQHYTRKQEEQEEKLTREIKEQQELLEQFEKQKQHHYTRKQEEQLTRYRFTDKEIKEQKELLEQFEKQKQEQKKDQERKDLELAKYLNKMGGVIQIINDRCDNNIKNINDSNCKQKIQKIQKIQYVRNKLIENTKQFFNKKINK